MSPGPFDGKGGMRAEDEALAGQLIAELGKRVGNPGLTLEDAPLVVEVEGQPPVVVLFDAAEGSLLLLSPVRERVADQPGLLANALALNLGYKDTAGNTLAFDRKNDTLVLQRSLPLEGTSYARLEAALLGFLDALGPTAAKLDAADSGDEETPRTADPGVPMPPFA
jgi:hypothetical protein